jgi:hypothetical protein
LLIRMIFIWENLPALFFIEFIVEILFSWLL